MPKLDLYALGARGVDLTNSVIHTEDGTFSSAQNATPDVRGEAGAVTKRDGLTAINSSALAGAIKGAVYAPLTDRSGTNAATARRVYIACNPAPTTPTWSFSTDSFVSVTSDITTSPAAPTDASANAAGGGAVTAVTIDNKIYYVPDAYTDNVDAPPVRVFDGVVDREFVRLPNNPDTSRVFPIGVSHMIAVGSIIYIAVMDAGTTSANEQSSVLSLDTRTGVITRIGATFPTGKTVHILAWHLGRLWAFHGCNDFSSTTSKIYFIRPGIDTAWTDDETLPADSGHGGFLIDFRGTLFAGFYGFATTSPAAIHARSPADGSWSVNETSAVGDEYRSCDVFKDNLYTTKFVQSGGGALVRKYDGTSWSTVLDVGVDVITPVQIFHDGGNLYAVCRNSSGFATVYVSSDGASWSAARTVDSDTGPLMSYGVVSVAV